MIAHQLDSIGVASCGYLSPVCDPFQEVEETYRLSEKIVGEFVKRNLPIEFITKCKVPRQVIELMAGHPHCFGQFSFVTGREALRKRLMQGGATIDELFESMEQTARQGLPVVMRIDPIIPYLSDGREELLELVKRSMDCGATHIVASVLDVPLKIVKEVFAKFRRFGVAFLYDLTWLYSEFIDGYLHARIDYRKRVFDYLRNLCDREGITFALCMEYELIDGRPVGLNREFMSSTNCEGVNVPIYRRVGERFMPAASCSGACLVCTNPECGIEDLAMGLGKGKMDFTLADYRKWTRLLEAGDDRAKSGKSTEIQGALESQGQGC